MISVKKTEVKEHLSFLDIEGNPLLIKISDQNSCSLVSAVNVAALYVCNSWALYATAAVVDARFMEKHGGSGNMGRQRL